MSGNANTKSDILLAGAFAAFTIDLLVYPLDTLKTRLQSPDYHRLYTQPGKDGSSKTLLKPALFRGLYQGLFSVVIATLPSSGAFFTTYESLKTFLTRVNPTVTSPTSTSLHAIPHPLIPQPVVHSLASSFAELVSCAILTPAEVIKQNAQMVDRSRPGGASTNATLETLRKFRSNPLALWRGYTALAGRNLPFTALQFPMFERLKEALRRRRLQSKGLDPNNGAKLGVLESGCITALSAGSAGAVAAVVTTPIDVVKTRIMLAAAEEGAGVSTATATRAGKDALVDAMGKTATEKGSASLTETLTGAAKRRGGKGAWATGKDIVRNEGMKALWRGGALRGVWTMVGSGLYLGVYESGRIYLASRRGETLSDDDL